MSLDITLYFPVDVGHDEPEWHVVYEANITHNLSKMAGEAGVYECVWRPGENGYDRAGQIAQPLEEGILQLHASPKKFRELNPANGWGDYEGLIEWLEAYLSKCRKYPMAWINASR